MNFEKLSTHHQAKTYGMKSKYQRLLCHISGLLYCYSVSQERSDLAVNFSGLAASISKSAGKSVGALFATCGT
jgi:hypothetical protein